MKPAFEFIEKHPDKILYFGEFGTIVNADTVSRENWMRDIFALCDEYEMPFCAWNYLSTPYDGNKFSLVDDRTREVLSKNIAAMIRGRQ